MSKRYGLKRCGYAVDLLSCERKIEKQTTKKKRMQDLMMQIRQANQRTPNSGDVIGCFRKQEAEPPLGLTLFRKPQPLAQLRRRLCWLTIIAIMTSACFD